MLTLVAADEFIDLPPDTRTNIVAAWWDATTLNSARSHD